MKLSLSCGHRLYLHIFRSLSIAQWADIRKIQYVVLNNQFSDNLLSTNFVACFIHTHTYIHTHSYLLLYTDMLNISTDLLIRTSTEICLYYLCKVYTYIKQVYKIKLSFNLLQVEEHEGQRL